MRTEDEAPYLENNSALKHYQHEEREETIIPIIVQAPKGYAEYLEYEEGGCSVFTEQRGEARNRYIEFVLSVELDGRFEGFQFKSAQCRRSGKG